MIVLKLFVKDNTSGTIHEYGTNPHDAIILQEDGSLHYENMQSCVGTKFTEEGYSFCLEDGSIPGWDVSHGVEPYIDIAGEYYAKPKTNADRIRAMSDEELADIVVCPHCKTNWDKCTDDCFTCRLEWLKQPAEGADNG
jgi:hypothetical protein